MESKHASDYEMETQSDSSSEEQATRRPHKSGRHVREDVMNPAQEKIEKIDQRLRIQPLRGGNLLYIT